MRPRTAIVLIIGAAIIGIIAYWTLSQGCLDGRGTDSYFDKSGLRQFASIDQFSLENVRVLASASQSCALTRYAVDKDGTLKLVGKQEFVGTVNAYNAQCNGCLIIHRQGFPFAGELFDFTSKKPLCDQPTNRQFEDCVPLER